MKKTILMAAIAALVLTSCGSSRNVTYAPAPVQKDSEMSKKDAEIGQPLSGAAGKTKEWTAQGWVVTGGYGMFTMYDLLDMHYKKLMSDMDRYTSVVGVGTHGSATVNAKLSSALLFAQYQAAVLYATRAANSISGGITGSTGTETNEKIVAAYTMSLQKKILPAMRESISVYREKIDENGAKVIEVQAYYLVDEEKAKTVREDAAKEVITELALDAVVADQVMDLSSKLAGMGELE